MQKSMVSHDKCVLLLVLIYNESRLIHMQLSRFCAQVLLMVGWILATSSLPPNLPLGESFLNLNLGGFIQMHVYIVIIVRLDFYLLKIFCYGYSSYYIVF